MRSEAAIDDLYAGSIVDTIRESLLLLDDDLRVVMANRSFCEAFGVPRDQLSGRHLFEVNDGAWDQPSLRHLLEQVLPSGNEIRDYELSGTGPGGLPRTLLLNARRLQHPGGHLRLILLALDDITERRSLERALQLTMAELKRSNRELESFASVASHDLQEPLRKIRAFGERLEAACDGTLPEKGRDYLARMTAAAARMQQLITDLLALARVTTKGTALRPVDLGGIVSSVLGDLEFAVSASGARVQVGLLPTIEADPTQMRQLFQNLIANALKFRGPEPPVVTIATAGAVPGVCRVVVADNGIGFEQIYAERIFGTFERLHAREAFEGTGIGLALCRRIVERHGGAIHADSHPGHGARFTVDLPARQKDPS